MPPDTAQQPTPETPEVPEGAWGNVEFEKAGRPNDIFFAAVEKTRMPMIVTDPHQPDNPIIFANNAFLNMTGYGPEDLLGHNCRFLQGPDTDRHTVDEIRKAIAERRDIATEILNYRKNGSSFWNALFVSPVFGNDGELLYFFGSQLDVSRRRDAEDSLRQSQKMEALGQLTGGIAHDFNNLLQVMLGYLEIGIRGARSGRPDPARHLRNLENAQAAAQRATTLTQQLLAFSRKQRLQGRSVNLNDTVTAMNELAQRTLGDDVEVRMVTTAGLWNCRVDPSQCEVALLNILLNARDALQGRPVRAVTIETRNYEVGEVDVQNFAGLPPGRYVAVNITDTGCGMSTEVRHRVMDPFFTTKEEGQGTGLGMSMVYGFVKQSGGTVRIYSEEGVGTTIRIFFPATDSEVARPTEPSTRAMDMGGDETILVVEDRPEVGNVAQTFLEDLGYTILRAEDGREALAVLEQAAHVDLLFSDLIMPGGMNGVVLAREARRRKPKLKVLITTGYAEASIERVDAGGSEFEIINKPYRQQDLGRKVRQVLEGPTGVT